MVIANNEKHKAGKSSNGKCGKRHKAVVTNNGMHEEGRHITRKRKMAITNNERGDEEGRWYMVKRCKKRSLSQEEERIIWVNVLSRLPIKTLMACKSVCKSWRRKVSLVKKGMESLPVDGLFIRSSSFGENIENQCHISYISLTTKKTIEMQINSRSSLIVGSSYDMDFVSELCSEFGGLCVENSWKATRVLEGVSNTIGDRPQVMCASTHSMTPYCLSTQNSPNNKTKLLENFVFDFGGLYVQNPSQDNNLFFAIHRGLILVIHEDGAYRVYNPATRNVCVLPKSPVCMEYSDRSSEGLLERAGFIIQLQSPIISVSSYMVVRLCRVSKKVEVYRSYRHRKWRVSSFSLDDELMNAFWFWENYVFIPGARTLCFLTDKDRGVVVKLNSRSDVHVYSLSLPSYLHKRSKYARIGGCGGGSLYISCYCNNDNVGGVWIWKHVDGGWTSAQDAWVPLVEISQARIRQLSYTCIPSELVPKVFMDVDDHLILPMGFHPLFMVVYLKVNSFIFAYDITSDTLEEIGEVSNQVFRDSTIILPYSPCLANLKPFIMK